MEPKFEFVEKVSHKGTVYNVYQMIVNGKVVCLKAVREGGSAYTVYAKDKETLLRNISRYYIIMESDKSKERE